jgi:hypothetical protein
MQTFVTDGVQVKNKMSLLEEETQLVWGKKLGYSC